MAKAKAGPGPLLPMKAAAEGRGLASHLVCSGGETGQMWRHFWLRPLEKQQPNPAYLPWGLLPASEWAQIGRFML